MENSKERLFISDWAISQSNLEDVFVRIVDPVENENGDEDESVD